MNIPMYNALLAAFYEGTTTLEEEKKLRAFFDSDKVPADLMEEKSRFLACYALDHVEVPAGLLNRLSTMIDEKAALSVKRPNQRGFRAPWIWTTAAAASLLLLFTIGISELGPTATDSLYTDTYSNPALAAKEADKALQLMAQKLNIGYQSLYCANVRYDKAEQTVNKQFAKLTK